MAKANMGLKNAIKAADFRPKRLTAKPDEVRKLLLGTLIGQATNTFMQPDPSDPTNVDKMQEGIIGVFQFTDAETNEVIRAPKLWVPDTIANLMKDSLRSFDPETGEIKKLASGVECAFHVFAIRSTAALGYTWLFEPVFEVTEVESDPIAALTKRMAQAALPAPDPVTVDVIEKEPAPEAKPVGKAKSA